MRDTSNRPLPRRQAGASVAVLALVITGALGGVAALGTDIPGAGTMQWRNPGGGTGGDGVAFNRFVGLRQSLVSLSDDPVFYARVEGTDVDLTRQMYWKLLTLDVFDGTFWRPRELDFQPVSEVPSWEEPALAYRGPTQRVVQTVAIATLRDDRLPVLYSPVALTSEHDVIRSGAEVAPDASLRINALTYEDLVYQVESQVPTLDVAALASREGTLTPLFEAAASEGLFDVGPVDGVTPSRPPALDAFLQLPSDIDPSVADLAEEVTAAASAPFEQALLLEDFFLQNFDYSTQVSTGHSALDLAAWLNDPDSPNYREGYCEQFATAMGVMGRQLGLPTRVVMGFTPGQRDADSGLTIVRQRNAHAWVEVWFDQAGWVRFDPTPRGDGTTSPTATAVGFEPGAIGLAETLAGVTATDQPGFIDDIPNLPTDDVSAGAPGIGRQALRWPAALGALAALAAAVPTWKSLRRRRRRRRAEEDDMTAVWDEIVDRLSDLGSPPAPHTTPVEYAATQDRALVPLAHAYSAAVYGEHRVEGASRHLLAAERWIDSRYDGRRRIRAAFSLRSLRRR